MNYINNSIKIPSIVDYFSQFKLINFKKGEIVQRPGLPNLGVFYVESGCIKKYVTTISGEEKIIKLYSSDEIFPITKLFQKNSREFFAETLMETTARVVNENDLREFLKKNSKAMTEFLDYLIDHVEGCYERIENLSFITSLPRVMFRLLCLAEIFGRIKDNRIILDLPLTQKDIANTTAMTRETVGRELDKLKKEGIVDCKDKTVVIKDISKLIKKMNMYQEIDWRITGLIK
jgi:CRP/FNR family transcriptional regulator, cyclic AMP receptor protein